MKPDVIESAQVARSAHDGETKRQGSIRLGPGPGPPEGGPYRRSVDPTDDRWTLPTIGGPYRRSAGPYRRSAGPADDLLCVPVGARFCPAPAMRGGSGLPPARVPPPHKQ